MAGKTRPCLMKKTLSNVIQSNLSITDKKCIGEVFTKVEKIVMCKNCKQFMEYAEGVQCVEDANGDCFIRMMHSVDKQFCGVKYDDFCSYGERRDSNG